MLKKLNNFIFVSIKKELRVLEIDFENSSREFECMN